MLTRKPGRNIVKLFQFQLSNRIDVADLTEFELDYVRSEGKNGGEIYEIEEENGIDEEEEESKYIY